MAEKNNNKKDMNLYEIINLDIVQKFFPKKKKDIGSFYLSKNE